MYNREESFDLHTCRAHKNSEHVDKAIFLHLRDVCRWRVAILISFSDKRWSVVISDWYIFDLMGK